MGEDTVLVGLMLTLLVLVLALLLVTEGGLGEEGGLSLPDMANFAM